VGDNVDEAGHHRSDEKADDRIDHEHLHPAQLDSGPFVAFLRFE
jgi:hypothetical protein